MASTSPFSETITLSLHPSKQLLFFIVGVHVFVALVALSTPAFPFWARLLMAGVVGISAWRSLQLHYWQKSDRAIKAIKWLETGEWQIQVGKDPTWQTVSLGQSFVKRWVLILGFKHPLLGHVNTIVPPDSVDDKSTWQHFIMRWLGNRQHSL
jgi:hypothetical protein